MKKLIYSPDADGYSWTDGQDTTMVQLDGGAPKVRTDILNASALLQATWTLDQDKYDYFRSFYKVVNSNFAGKFKCDLIMDSPYLTEHDCIFVPKTMTLKSQSGLTYVVGCQISVMPQIPDLDYMNAKIDFIEAFGGICAANKAINLFDSLANIYLPRINN